MPAKAANASAAATATPPKTRLNSPPFRARPSPTLEFVNSPRRPLPAAKPSPSKTAASARRPAAKANKTSNPGSLAPTIQPTCLSETFNEAAAAVSSSTVPGTGDASEGANAVANSSQSSQKKASLLKHGGVINLFAVDEDPAGQLGWLDEPVTTASKPAVSGIPMRSPPKRQRLQPANSCAQDREKRVLLNKDPSPPPSTARFQQLLEGPHPSTTPCASSLGTRPKRIINENPQTGPTTERSPTKRTRFNLPSADATDPSEPAPEPSRTGHNSGDTSRKGDDVKGPAQNQEMDASGEDTDDALQDIFFPKRKRASAAPPLAPPTNSAFVESREISPLAAQPVELSRKRSRPNSSVEVQLQPHHQSQEIVPLESHPTLQNQGCDGEASMALVEPSQTENFMNNANNNDLALQSNNGLRGKPKLSLKALFGT